MSPAAPSWLVPLFFLSGVSGLVYQVVWMRMLIRVFGITVDATSAVVAVFMGGLALGSWLAGRRQRTLEPSLRLYAAIELGVAVSAALATAAMSRLPALYAALAGPPGADGVLLRLGLTAVVLVVPTALMGATLPILVRVSTRDDAEVGRRLGTLYGWNTLGAVAGVLGTGFSAIAALGESGSTALAVFLNLAIAAFVWTRPGLPKELEAPKTDPFPLSNDSQTSLLLLAALGGFAALGYEVVWTRMLIPLLGSSVYAFSLMLAAYLAGIALGSLAIGGVLDRLRSPLAAFGWGQAALALAGALSLRCYGWLGLRMSHPKYLYSPLQSPSDLLFFAAVGVAVVFPMTFILGALFPLLHRALTKDAADSGRAVGRLYAWNTVGGVLGALAAGHWLMPRMGTQAAFAALTMTSFAAALWALAGSGTLRRAAPALGAVGLALILGLPLSRPLSLDIITERLAQRGLSGEILFHRDEAAATLTGVRTGDGSQDLLLINGILTSGEGRAGAAMVHLPLMFHGAVKKALVICFGVGTTFRSAVDHVREVDAVELVSGVVDSFRAFSDDADAYLNRPGVRVFIDDGRNHLLRSRDEYDVMVIDASPPIFSAGTVNLYSLEFLALANDRLTERGILALWVPTPCFERDFWMITRNFGETFPSMAAWARKDLNGILLMGSRGPLDTTFKTPPEPWLTREYYAEGWLVSGSQLRAASRSLPLITDDRPRTEFPLHALLAREKLWPDGEFLRASVILPK
ncbi:MAG: fused MFS/spermidine synthase [Elusimicrobia bacterium]|nr:fused MFS/spermidine synthase [Elusimicrobiota bacterium]